MRAEERDSSGVAVGGSLHEVNWQEFGSRLALWTSIVLLVGVTIIVPPFVNADAYAYWSVWPDPYDSGVVGDTGAYLYSPAFAQLIWPLTLLPFPVFFLLWKALHALALVYLVGWRWAGFVAALAWPLIEFDTGNIHLFLAAAIAFGGAGWAFVILTKVTPGIGLLWFAVRREWRQLGIALGVTAAVSVVSFLLAPELWAEWFAVLSGSTSVESPGIVLTTIPLLYRLPVAALVAIVGAWKGWPWTIALSAFLAMPAMWWGSVVLFLAVPRLMRVPSSR